MANEPKKRPPFAIYRPDPLKYEPEDFLESEPDHGDGGWSPSGDGEGSKERTSKSVASFLDEELGRTFREGQRERLGDPARHTSGALRHAGTEQRLVPQTMQDAWPLNDLAQVNSEPGKIPDDAVGAFDGDPPTWETRDQILAYTGFQTPDEDPRQDQVPTLPVSHERLDVFDPR